MAERIPTGLVASTFMIDGSNSGGTGFLVVRPDVYDYANPEDHDWGDSVGAWRVWYVTCAHVVDHIAAIDDRITVRMNEKGSESGVTTIKIPDTHWTRHPKWKPLWHGTYQRAYSIEDAEYDVAVAIAPTHYEKWDELFQGAWPAHWQLTKGLIEQYRLYEGNEIFTVGFR